MKLLLERRVFTPQSTIGRLSIDGHWECFILEPCYRGPGEAKVPGATCIPVGTYEVRVTHSPRFGRDLPLVLDVPGFSGIRIHPGNRPADTLACLCPGRTVEPDFVGESVAAFDVLFAKLIAAQADSERITLEIRLT